MKDKQIEVIPLNPADIDSVAKIQARAFLRNPSTLYMFGGQPPDEKKWAWLLGTDTRYCLLHGMVYTTPDLAGIASWLPPEHKLFSFRGMLNNPIILTPLKTGVRPALRLFKMIRYSERVQKQFAPARFYYLSTLSVAPRHQGKGIGSALIAPVLARADAGQMPCYLETETEGAVRFYQKHGFRIVHKGALPGSSPVFYAMLREPQ